MKADERKENETNSLRQWFDRTALKMKGRGAYMAIGSVVTVLILAGVIWFYFSSRAAAASARQMELYTADTDKKLDEIIASENQQGHRTLIWAKLQKARLVLYRDGLEKLGSFQPADRKSAVSKVEEGRKHYLDIVEELKDSPSLQQECWTSTAKAELSLCGTPKEDRLNEYRGSIDKAVEYYRKAGAIDAESEASKKYISTADDLAKNKTTHEEFYRRLNQLGINVPLP